MSFWTRWLRLVILGPKLAKQIPAFRTVKRRRPSPMTLEYFEERVLPSAVVWTDKPAYAPGETAVIKGAGYQPGEAVALQLTRSDGALYSAAPVTDGGAGDLDGVADGNLTTRWTLPGDSPGFT